MIIKVLSTFIKRFKNYSRKVVKCGLNFKSISLLAVLFLLILFVISLSFGAGTPPHIKMEDIETYDNKIENYIIDEDIDLRTLNSSIKDDTILEQAKRSLVEDNNITNEYEFCEKLYTTTFPNNSYSRDYCLDNPNEKNWIEERQFAYYAGPNGSEDYALSALACFSCESGTYESADRNEYCKCDEGERCFDYFTKSTAVVGGNSACFFSCTYQERTDKCTGINTLLEYYVDCYCCDEVFETSYNCNNVNSYSTWYSYCSGDEVWKHRWYWDYDCSVGACAYDSSDSGWVDDTYVKTCNCGCSGGECISLCPPDISVIPLELIFNI